MVPTSTTLNDFERHYPVPVPLRTLFQNTCVFGAHHENLNEDRPTPTLAISDEDVVQ